MFLWCLECTVKYLLYVMIKNTFFQNREKKWYQHTHQTIRIFSLNVCVEPPLAQFVAIYSFSITVDQGKETSTSHSISPSQEVLGEVRSPLSFLFMQDSRWGQINAKYNWRITFFEHLTMVYLIHLKIWLTFLAAKHALLPYAAPAVI